MGFKIIIKTKQVLAVILISSITQYTSDIKIKKILPEPHNDSSSNRTVNFPTISSASVNS